MLREDRKAVLLAIANGLQPEVQRNRLRWFVKHGWLEVQSDGAAPSHKLVRFPAKARAELGMPEADGLYFIRLQLGGYRSLSVKQAGRP